MHIKKNDTVFIRTGASRGKKGKVLRVFPELGKVLVEGVNTKKKHVRAQGRGEKNVGGKVIELEFPVAISNVSLLDPKSGKPTRIGWKVDEKGKKVRIAKKSGQVIT